MSWRQTALLRRVRQRLGGTFDALAQAARPYHVTALKGQACPSGQTSGRVPAPAACAALQRLVEMAARARPVRLDEAAAELLGTRCASGAELVGKSLAMVGLVALAWPSPWTAHGLLRRVAMAGRWVVPPERARAYAAEARRTGGVFVEEELEPGDVIGWRCGVGGDLAVVESVHRITEDRGVAIKRLAGVARVPSVEV